MLLPAVTEGDDRRTKLLCPIIPFSSQCLHEHCERLYKSIGCILKWSFKSLPGVIVQLEYSSIRVILGEE